MFGHVQLFATPMDCSMPGSSVHEILQARKMEGVDISSSGAIPDPGIKFTSLVSPALAGGFVTPSAREEVQLTP